MANIANLLTEHIDIWTAADTEKKSGRGRASVNAGSVYGIKKLRGLILELAVRGKLVPQDANDEPASELLKRIQAEKAKLIAEGKLKKEKPLAPIGEDEKPFELPKGWYLCRWNSIAMKIGDIDHKMPETVSNGIPYVSPRDFYANNVIDFNNAKQVSKEADKPVLTLTKSQIRKIFRKLKQQSISTCACGRDAEKAALNIVERKLYEKGGF